MNTFTNNYFPNEDKHTFQTFDQKIASMEKKIASLKFGLEIKTKTLSMLDSEDEKNHYLYLTRKAEGEIFALEVDIDNQITSKKYADFQKTDETNGINF